MLPRPVILRAFALLLSFAGAWAAQAPGPEEPVVMLPPLRVEARGVPLKWNYFAAPGLEVLAACGEKDGVEIVERMLQLDRLMTAILPERFMPAVAVPETLILLEEKAAQAQAREVLAGAMAQSKARIRFMPNIRLVDRDSSVVFALVGPSASDRFVYAGERVVSLLESRVPRLPEWFIEGMRGFYGQVRFNAREIEVGSGRWISREESAALAADPNRPRTLLPMEEFFAGQRQRFRATPLFESEWSSQAALFVRWALLENNGANREALWRFVDRLEKEPVSEALLREHFGLGYSDLRDELSDYLSGVMRQQTKIPAPPVSASAGNPVKVKFRAATELEIARIRGDWERQAIAYVRGKSPELVDHYIEQARWTLYRAYHRGERDPRLLAAMGLTEIDAGNPTEARPLLEMAVEGNVVRPRAYFELARLRYGAVASAAGPNGKLKVTQVAEVLEPLFAGQRQEPPLLENYALMAEVVNRSDSPPTAAQLKALHEGALKFPGTSELVVQAIYFHLLSDQPAAAAALISVGLLHARDPAMRAKFERANASFSGSMPAKE
jgi:hypothetical protein